MKYDKFFIAFALCMGIQTNISFCGQSSTYDSNELYKQLHSSELYSLLRTKEPIANNEILNFFGPNDVKVLEDYRGKLDQELEKSVIHGQEWMNEYNRLMATATVVGSEHWKIIEQQLEPYVKEAQRANDLYFTMLIISEVKSLIEKTIK